MSRTSYDIRQAFLGYFAKNGHEVVASGPLAPPNDPTLLFAAAGMVQFKDVFTGREQRPYKRATSAQKCIRISGKHNDLENVGPSPRHHTFFEMLGNFSFGDYFKEQAIVFAWEFLTRELDLPQDRLVLTYFKGEDGIPADETARDLWKKVTGFSDDRIIGMGMADNFWSAGDTGPCGPCSEIHWFHGPTPDPSTFGAEQSPEGFGWMEIWNLVFMQFERSLSGELTDLPAPSIDTGAGLERLAGVVQGKTNNYDTDILRGLVERAASIAGKPYGGTMSPDDVSMRVIADHARTTAFLLAEGILPDKNGREYVLRRVMRRAIRHGHRLGIERPFLHEVALAVGELMGDQYPELREKRELTATVVEQEEVRFRQTIERGLGLLQERFDRMTAAGQTELSGHDAFQLYDTYGFPLDLTQVICNERHFTVNEAEYDQALADARLRSEDFKNDAQVVESVYRDALTHVAGGAVRFTGYDKVEDRSEIAALISAGSAVDTATEGQDVELVTSVTPFYGEGGGQLGDHGVVETETGTVQVDDAQKPLNGLTVLKGRVRSGTVSAGQAARLVVDVHKRDATRRNHSATHLLHLALRTILGGHVQQKGSLVGPERLRFDFTHGKPMTEDEIRRVENFVNDRVLGNSPVQTEVLTIDNARKRGAMMIFEEKYGDVVRMLSMADSVELCGGTHARATGDIGLFKIVSEQGVAAGVRRILATTGDNSLDYLRELEHKLDRAARAAKATGGDVAEKIEKILLHERQLEKQIEDLQRKLMSGGGSGGIDAMLAKARDINGAKVLGVRSEVADRGKLRELAEQLRDKLGNSVVLVGSAADDKAQLVLMVAKSLTERFKAGDLIRELAAVVGGSGGGPPHMAQAGGTDVSRLDEAIEGIYSRVERA
jgi:alanyl-tRNA synthetase